MSAVDEKQRIAAERLGRARAIAKAGGFEEALATGALPRRVDATLSELLVLGLLRQGLRKFVSVFGHGSTEIGEVLRLYQQAGLIETYNVRNEIEGAHAASALRWVTGEKAAVITSIGPGAMQAFAAALLPASDGLGVWFIFGDETTEDEGPNMQQAPGTSQHAFLKMFSGLAPAYNLHTPGALPAALRRGMNAVDAPLRGSPFFLLCPMNTQPREVAAFNLNELPVGVPPPPGAAADFEDAYGLAADLILAAERVVVRVGGGATDAGAELLDLLELADGVAVNSPLVPGLVPFEHPRNMTVGGSKGSISGNYAMENADLLIAVGTRFVCQSDSSRTGYPNVKHVVNLNIDPGAATHYGRTVALVGDAKATLELLNAKLRAKTQEAQADAQAAGPPGESGESAWLRACRAKRREWDEYRAQRYQNPLLYDPVWGREVLTQPAAIKVAADWCRATDTVAFFDAGDVQANGFQIVEEDRPGRVYTDTGASYMGFAVSALLATALAERPFYGAAFTGDGSFTMNPQILIDGVYHGARGVILLFDNRRMAAISGLQQAQYGNDFGTADFVEVDYMAWANSVSGVLGLSGGNSADELGAALNRAREHDGLSLIHIPVYYGPDELGGMGVFGRWNVGNQVEATQARRHEIGL